MLRSIAFCALWLFLAAASAPAATVYVDVGAPSGGDGTASHPYQSIQTGADHGQGGDVIQIQAGNYYQALDMSGKSFTLAPQGEVVLTLFEPMDCEMTAAHPLCPRIVPQEQNAAFSLEPSGLVWNQAGGYWIGVSDNYNDLGPAGHGEYALFGFEEKADVTGKLFAFPLLSAADAQALSPNDMEGLTRLPNGILVALGSLSLHSKKAQRDTWYRFRGFSFSLSGKSAQNPTLLSRDYRQDLREWVISSAEIPWAIENITSRPETGPGINVEGLASAANGDLLIGFRGPLWTQGGTQRALVLTTNQLPPNDLPVSRDRTYMPVAEGDGIRGFERVPLDNRDLYVLLLGRSDNAHDPLSYAVWDRADNTLMNLGDATLPEGFVAEGIDVRELTQYHGATTLVVGIVDDLSAKFMKKTIYLSN